MLYPKMNIPKRKLLFILLIILSVGINIFLFAKISDLQKNQNSVIAVFHIRAFTMIQGRLSNI